MLTGIGNFVATHSVDLEDERDPRAWRRKAWGLASALANEGHFSWEDLRQALLVEQGVTASLAADEFAWSDCQGWLRALARVSHASGLVDAGPLAALARWAELAERAERTEVAQAAE